MKEKKKIIVLGAGLVGGPMAIDLAKEEEFQVSAVDVNKNSLDKLKDYPVTTIQMDLSNPEKIQYLVKDYDFVINALPGVIGFRTLEAVIRSRKNIVDISFFEEDPFLLDELAKKNNVIAIVDCGVCPGMSNVLIGYVDHLLDETENVYIFVGGLPKIREWPYEYKAVFSPMDVIEEYIRPARFIENGKLVTKPALSDREYINFEGIGTLEAFNTDGLRTLLKTIKVKNMREKTLRYPGHCEKMLILRETGFFSKQEIEIDGKRIRPIDFTSKILFPKWKLEEGEADLTVLRIIIEGKKEKKRLRYTYEMFDRYDEKTQTHSMARTTGYTATASLRMIVKGLYTRIGISAPEFVGENPKCVEFMLSELKKRGVIYREKIEKIV
ncbi:MAG: saccharopine dehydrogenase family protein [Promethearchaeota archaeon]